MDSLKDKIDLKNLPSHIAVIMDGNGRWAKQSGMPRLFGHKNGVTAVREITETCAELGVQYLTLYSFSTENWNRPSLEVQGLMMLLVETVHSELKTLQNNNIRLMAIGDLSKLPQKTQDALLDAIALTRHNTRMTLVLALNYSARWEILHAVNHIIQDTKSGLISSEINENQFVKYLTTADIPDPELLIRTSGEYRISNFLLYQLAYTELHFTPVLWPDFRKNHLYEAVIDFQSRERRFGKTSEQVSTSK
jgi:undecaprenyl diphosphate synthase